MDQVERLSRLRLTKRNKRKLSLPVLLNQFHLQFDGDSQTSKLEAITGSPVRNLQDKKSHSTPSSSEKLGRSHSLSSPGELDHLKNYKKCTGRLESTTKFEGYSQSIDILKKCSRKLDVTPEVFSPSNSHKPAEHMVDDTQVKVSKLSSTLLSPIPPVCDPWLSSTTPESFKYLCATNINQKETSSGELNDCGNEAEKNYDNLEMSSQSTCPIQKGFDSSSSQYYKKDKKSFKRKGIRRSSQRVPIIDQNFSSKDDDNLDHGTKNKEPECTENRHEAEMITTNTKVGDCGKGLMTIMEFLKDPVNDQPDTNKGKLHRLSLPLPMETSLSLSPVDGYRTPVDSIIESSQVNESAPKTKDNEDFGTILRRKSSKLSPLVTPKRKGVQKIFPWTSTTDESITLLENEKTEKTEMGSFSKEGPFRGIRESKKNKRWSSIFPASDEDLRMDSLSQKLDFYSKTGLIKLHISSINIKKYQAPDESLERSWECLVDSPELLSKHRRQQQSTIWELVTTEVTYLNTLKVIVDIFLSCLVNLQTDLLLVEIDTQMLFSNIQDIYAANLVLWHEHIIKMIDFSRTTGQPLDPTFLFDAFCKVEELLHPYTQYCLEQMTCHDYCRDKDFESIYFKTYLAWCETQRECNRLRLADILVTPMQRLTKYSLLLQAISKKTTEDDYKDLLDEMICSVDKFVSKVNNTLRYHHDQKMIWDISTRIEAYEVVGLSKEEELEKVVKVYSQLNLQQSMPGCPPHHQRSLLFHGDMKLRDAQTSKLDVHVFIFTDMLLITKSTQKKGEKLKIIRPPFHISRLVVIDVKDVTSVGLIYINEWKLAEASFTLQCHSEQLQKAWTQTLKQAQERYKILQESKDNMDDSYVSDLPMYTRGFEATNDIQSLPIHLTSLGTSPNVDSVCTSGFSSVVPSPNVDSVCTSGFSSVVPSKDLGASPNINLTNSSGISSIVNSNCGTVDLSQYISTNSSDKFTFLHPNDLCKTYSLDETDEVDQIINNRKLDDGEFTSSMWIGYSSMPESPENIHSDLDDLEDSGIVSGNVIRIPVKYGSKNSFISPSTNKYPHSSKDRFSSMTNISSTPKSIYENSDEKVIPRDEMKEKLIGNIPGKISENKLNEQMFCTRINITLGESQTTDPEFSSESILCYGRDKLCISSTPDVDLNNNGCILKSNEFPSTSSSLIQKRLLETQSDCTDEVGCLRRVINISPMKCDRSKTSNISTTYIYQDNQDDTNITFGGFSQYITDSHKQYMRPIKSFKEEYSCIIKIAGSEMDQKVSSTDL